MEKDRRKFIRFDVPFKVEIGIKADIDYIKEVTAKDFSREGVGLILRDFKFEEGTQIQLRFFLPPKPEPVSATARIKWVGKIKDDWQMGVKLDEIDDSDKSEILDFVYEKWRQKHKSSKKINNNP